MNLTAEKAYFIREEIRESTLTQRDPRFYFRVFDLGATGESIRGQTILDIGSGKSGFVEAVNKNGLAHAVAMDPQYFPLMKTGKEVRGVAQQLPFREGSFDLVLASYSVYWVATDLYQTLTEILRVTKSGGEVKIYPTLLVSRQKNRHAQDYPLEIDLTPHENWGVYSPYNLTFDTLTIRKGPDFDEHRRTQVLSWVCSNVNLHPQPRNVGSRSIDSAMEIQV